MMRLEIPQDDMGVLKMSRSPRHLRLEYKGWVKYLDAETALWLYRVLDEKGYEHREISNGMRVTLDVANCMVLPVWNTQKNAYRQVVSPAQLSIWVGSNPGAYVEGQHRTWLAFNLPYDMRDQLLAIFKGEE